MGKYQRDWGRNNAQRTRFGNSEGPILICLKSSYLYLFQAILDGGESAKSVCENALFGRLEQMISKNTNIELGGV